MSHMQELTLDHVNQFIDHQLDGLLQKLTPDLAPLWGSLTPHHMVEHLTWVVEGAMGRWEVPVMTPAEKLPKLRLFLRNRFAMVHHFKHPAMPPDGGLPPLRTPSLAAAIEEFWQRWAEFEQYSQANPDILTNHVTFGPLNHEEWRLMHFKHTVHHLCQFGVTTPEENGLVPLPPRP